jgi:hypothetical protein
MTPNGAGNYPGEPSLPGFSFTGWFENNGLSFDGDTFVVYDTDVSARWDLKPGIDSITFQVEGDNFVGTFSNGDKLNAALDGDCEIQTVNGNKVVELGSGAYISLPKVISFLNRLTWTLEVYVFIPENTTDGRIFSFAQEDNIATTNGVVYATPDTGNFIVRPDGVSTSGQVNLGSTRAIAGKWHVLSYVKFDNGWIDSYLDGANAVNQSGFNVLGTNGRLNPLNYGWLGKDPLSANTASGAMYYKFILRSTTFGAGTHAFPHLAEVKAKLAELNQE